MTAVCSITEPVGTRLHRKLTPNLYVTASVVDRWRTKRNWTKTAHYKHAQAYASALWRNTDTVYTYVHVAMWLGIEPTEGLRLRWPHNRSPPPSGRQQWWLIQSQKHIRSYPYFSECTASFGRYPLKMCQLHPPWRKDKFFRCSNGSTMVLRALAALVFLILHF